MEFAHLGIINAFNLPYSCCFPVGSIKEGYCAGSQIIKYAGFCQNNSRYPTEPADGMLEDIVLHSGLEDLGRKGIM